MYYLILNAHLGVNLAFPPIGLQRICLHNVQIITDSACENIVVI